MSKVKQVIVVISQSSTETSQFFLGIIKESEQEITHLIP